MQNESCPAFIKTLRFFASKQMVKRAHFPPPNHPPHTGPTRPSQHPRPPLRSRLTSSLNFSLNFSSPAFTRLSLPPSTSKPLLLRRWADRKASVSCSQSPKNISVFHVGTDASPGCSGRGGRWHKTCCLPWCLSPRRASRCTLTCPLMENIHLEKK